MTDEPLPPRLQSEPTPTPDLSEPQAPPPGSTVTAETVTPSGPTVLDHLAAAGISPAEVAAASDVAPAPADPLAAGITALEQRIAAVEAFIEETAGFIEALRGHFGGKIG